MNYKRLAVVGAALLSFSFNSAANFAEAAAPYVPEHIFRWVQSSARTSYFFNKREMCYAVDAEGNVDTNSLIVPVLKTYDDVMINDIVSKRRWNDKSLVGFGDLVGSAEYLTIDLNERTVHIDELDYLDSTWSTIDAIRPTDTIKLDNLSEKSLDAKFYDRVIDYAMRNQLVLADRTKGELSLENREKLSKAQAEYREEHEPDRPEDNEQ